MSFIRNRQFMGELKKKAADRLDAGSRAVQGQIVALIEAPKSGEKYSGNPRRSSRPGEPPANQTGGLVRSIEVFAPVDSGNAVSQHVGSTLIGAIPLEAGTANQAPRPFLRPGLMMSRRAVMDAMTEGGSNG